MKTKKPHIDAATSVGAMENPIQEFSPLIVSQNKATESVFIRIPEAMQLMQCSRSTAQRCFVEINEKLKAKGMFTISGRCNRQAFYQAIGFTPDGMR